MTLVSFLDGILSLLGVFCNLDFFRISFFPIIALCFICAIPAIIRFFTVWR